MYTNQINEGFYNSLTKTVSSGIKSGSDAAKKLVDGTLFKLDTDKNKLITKLTYHKTQIQDKIDNVKHVQTNISDLKKKIIEADPTDRTGLNLLKKGLRSKEVVLNDLKGQLKKIAIQDYKGNKKLKFDIDSITKIQDSDLKYQALKMASKSSQFVSDNADTIAKPIPLIGMIGGVSSTPSIIGWGYNKIKGNSNNTTGELDSTISNVSDNPYVKGLLAAGGLLTAGILAKKYINSKHQEINPNKTQYKI